MSSLLEKIAAKKAAEAALKALVSGSKEEAILEEAKKLPPEPTIQEVIAKARVESPTANAEPIAQKEEEAPKAEGKPLSFAEKMALKKASTSALAPAPLAAPTTISVATVQEKKEIPAEIVIGIVATVAEEEEHEENISKASPADQQAYADIKAKLSLLSDMADTELKGAMTELKKALLQNPQACYLMLPQDIGQMVVALRAMKNEAVVEASKDPKEKKAAKAKASKPLTADEIAAAFDEL